MNADSPSNFSLESIEILKNSNCPIFYKSQSGEIIGQGYQGIITLIKCDDGAEAACKFYKKSYRDKKLEKLTPSELSINLKKVTQVALTCLKLPTHQTVLQFKGVIFTEEHNQYGLVFERVSGVTLSNYLKQLPRDQRTEEIARIFKILALGLKTLSEAQMSHTDLLNPNILIRHEDKNPLIIDVDKEALDAEPLKEQLESQRQFVTLLYEALIQKNLGDSEMARIDAIVEIKNSPLPQVLKTTLEDFLSNKVVTWDNFARALSTVCT